MAITQMAKVIIVTHHEIAEQLLEELQSQGICQILNAEEAMVGRDLSPSPDAGQRPRDIEQLLNKLGKTISFLNSYARPQKGLGSILAPRAVIDPNQYKRVVTDSQILVLIDETEQLQTEIEGLNCRSEQLEQSLEMLEPWACLETPVEQLGRLDRTVCLAGFLAGQQFEETARQLKDLGGAVQHVGSTANKFACIVVCLKQDIAEMQKLLRSAEFEPVNFENLTGTIAQLLQQHRQKLNDTKEQLTQCFQQAAALSQNLLKLKILHDHYSNLLTRERTRDTAPVTTYTVFLEGWVKKSEYQRLQKIVSSFEASSLARIEPAKDEQIPVDIENKRVIKPFEVITRLYGMPQHFEVDPTVFLAPFFTLFFALCLTDAGYGLVLIALLLLFIKKMQGDKKLLWMLGICSAMTVVVGALTGGWFGDAVQKFIPALTPLRNKMMWFDPLDKPMMFFGLALALGYLQILTGLFIAFVHNLKRKEYIAAVVDQLTWLVMLNCVVIFGASKFGAAPTGLGSFCGKLALVPAVTVFLFSQRQGGWGPRLGMGFYNLFSGIFYMGDVLSYLRLMALGMVTAGLAMAINVIAKITLDIPYGIGIVVTIAVLIGGHGFNLAINALGAFVHTLRLQYAEFFPKFFLGGGRAFEPLAKEYKHVKVMENDK